MEGSSVDGSKCYVGKELEWNRRACSGEADYEYEGRWYCILHFPSDNKKAAFIKAIQSKLDRNDCQFSKVYFPSDLAKFGGATFSGPVCFFGADFSGEVDFRQATFSEEADFAGVTFSEEADFSGATFSEKAIFGASTFGSTSGKAVHFADVTFSGRVTFFGVTFFGGANFEESTFSKRASFRQATFSQGARFSESVNFSERADFRQATFSQWADFSGVTFSEEADFSGATFSERTEFIAATFKEGARFDALKVFPKTALLDFSNTTIEKPERISFHTTHLRPSWFVDVDAQKFDFSTVEWFKLPNEGELDEDGEELRLEDEIAALRSRGLHPPQSLRKLTKACRGLMNNAEENRDYPTADEMHYWSMEAQRKEGWSRLGLIATLYWALSGYGERPLRAFGVLVAMYGVFAVLYMLLPSSPFSIFSWSDVCEYQGCVGQAATYSLSALARLLPAEPKISPGLFQFLVTVEGLLGPLQIALLLLAVRRKVMR